MGCNFSCLIKTEGLARLKAVTYTVKEIISQKRCKIERDIVNTDQYYRMWANAQRDGRPAEYRWRPLFNAAKFG